eukprot:TRINITY_DN2606_c0_g1_i1.p1 TRINITY_DN2606_c0_g1~~TRINITY_DN2606_c0_g1_i1.p1  ORF type:complete len:1351 (+),score=211.78 TRINITY_DN2606_c0_g1_i1:263-4315(+)
MYPMGRTIAFREVSMDSNSSSKVTCAKIDDRLDTVTALALSVNHQFLALACKFLADKSAHIFFYDLSQGFRRFSKVVHEGTPTDSEGKSFISIAFSSDATRVAALTNPKMGTTKVYEWKKDVRTVAACSWLDELKKIAKGDDLAEIKKITVDPNDKDQVCMSGRNHLRIWRSSGGTLKPNPAITKLDTHKNFTDHAWIDCTWLVAVTDKGEIYFIYEAKECVIYTNAFGTITEPAISLLPYYRGLIVAGENGVLGMWEKKDPGGDLTEAMAHERNVKIDSRGKIVAMSVNGKDSNAVLTIGYKTNFISLLKLADLIKPAARKLERIFVDDGYHLGRTIEELDPARALYTTMDMDLAVHRPLIVTSCKTDSTLRIWNYHTRQCELVKCLTMQRTGTAPEPVRPLSVSFHPTGYLIAGGFDSQALIWHLLQDELRPFHVFSHYKHCTKVRFSHGGHLLAIAQMLSSSKAVFIHNTYTLTRLHTIKLPGSAMVCDIVFSPNDLLIALCCTDGYLIVYNTQTQKESMMHSSSRSVYFGCQINSQDDVIAFGSDDSKRGVVRHIVKDDIVKSVCLHNSRFVSGQFFYNKNLVLGTEDGFIKLLEQPLSDKTCFELNMHMGPVSKFLLSPDGHQAFTCGEDGVLFVYTVLLSNPIIELEQKPEESILFGGEKSITDIVLVERDKLKRDKANLETLMEKVQDLDSERKLVEEHLVRQHERKVAELEQEKNNAMAELEERLGKLREELTKREHHYTDIIRKMEQRHMDAVMDLESVFKAKLDLERQGAMNREQAYKEEIQTLQNTLQQREEEQVKEMVEDHERCGKDLERLSKKLAEIKVAQAEAEKKLHEKMKLQDEEHDKEMDLREANLHKEMAELKTVIKMKDEELNRNDTKIKDLIAERTDLNHRLKDLGMLRDQLQSQIAKLQTDLEKAARGRDEAVEEAKGLESSLLKTKAKYKDRIKECQTLAWTAKGLKDKLAPITEENDKLKTRINEIDAEYAEYMGIMEQQKVAYEKLDSKIHQQEESLAAKAKEIKEWENRFSELRRTIFKYKERKKTEKHAFEEMFTELYQKYVASIEDKMEKPAEVVDELDKQIKHLQDKNKSLEYNAELKIEKLDKMSKHLRSENSKLLKELNEAYQKLKDSDKYQVALENKLKILETKTAGKNDKKVVSASMQIKSLERSMSDEKMSFTQREKAQKKPIGQMYKGLAKNLTLVKAIENERAVDLNKQLQAANNAIFQLKMEVAMLRNENKKTKKTMVEKSDVDISSINISANENTKDSENIGGVSYSFLPQLPSVRGISKKIQRFTKQHFNNNNASTKKCMNFILCLSQKGLEQRLLGWLHLSNVVLLKQKKK